MLIYNARFWTETSVVSGSASFAEIAFLVCTFALLCAAQASLLMLVPGRWLLKAIIAFLFVAASVGAFFADTYGVSIDRETIRNLFETDTREARALFSGRFLLYICVLGVLPAAIVLRIKLARTGIKLHLMRAAAVIGSTAVLIVLGYSLFGAQYASFLREHKSVRYLLTPANIVYSVNSYLGRMRLAAVSTNRVDLESPVTRVESANSRRPLLLFLVIGETARAHNFQLGGYARATNPELTRRRVQYFSNVSSCGTSTAISLPCMFSGLGRAAFDVAGAQHNTNLLDALLIAGFRVQWRDNNSGCKGICSRADFIDYTTKRDPALCTESGCYDEVMLSDMQQELGRVSQDTVIVFHQAGSHGPAYSERYPKRFEVFKPVCYGNELSRCPLADVINAYDNSIVYTDFNLARQIDLLSSASEKADTALIYVSDHGESLGENGMYLHGAPFMFAPEQQTRVPMVLWMSESYRKRFAMSDSCLEARKGMRYTHDNLYHTVLGALGVTSARYQAALDMFLACRSAG